MVKYPDQKIQIVNQYGTNIEFGKKLCQMGIAMWYVETKYLVLLVLLYKFPAVNFINTTNPRL